MSGGRRGGVAELALAFIALFGGGLLAGCNSLANTAAKDPQTCERDPKCAKHARTFDCSEQCTDDPACVDRCEQVQQETGASSR